MKKFLFILSLLLLSGIAKADTGYLAAGVCWPTAQEATDAYYSSLPLGYVAPSTTLMYRVQYYKATNGNWYYTVYALMTGGSVYSSLFLPSNVYGTCTLSTSNVSYDYASAAAFWAFAFSTVISLWLVAKNAGVIISAVRRW